MIKMLHPAGSERAGEPPSTVKRRLTGIVCGAVLVGASCAGALIVTTGAASAATAASADISVSQRVSGGTASGQTIDTVTVHNAGTSTANSVEAVYLMKSAATSYTVHSSSAGLCQIEPAPPGYLSMATCPLGSVASGGNVVDTLTYASTPGVAFSVTASIGESSPADPNFANNTSTVSTYFGPRADLRLGGTLAAGSTAGTASAVTTVRDLGPNNASSLQEVIEIKAAGLTEIEATASTPAASCQFVPAATGFDRAVACVTTSLAANKAWVLKVTYTGPKGIALTTKSTVTANSPADPVPSNNTQTLTTHLHA